MAGVAGCRAATALGVAALGLLGAAVRCLPWRFVFSAEGVILIGTDPWYHLHRARMLAEQLPTLARLDPFLGFPTGAPIPWPPGFDGLIALPALLGASEVWLPAFGALLMPILGGSAVVLCYAFTARAFDRATAWVAAALTALMNGALQFSLLGRTDHHGLVAPLTLGMYLAFLASVRAHTPRARLGYGVLCGALAAVALGSWIVTPPMYWLPIPALAVLLCLRGEGRSLAAPSMLCTLFATLGALLVVLLTGDLGAHPFSLYQPSLFAVTLYALATAGVALAATRPRLVLPLAALVGMPLAAVLALAPQWIPPVATALAVARGQDVSYRIGWEIQPLLSHEGVFTLARAIHLYTYVGLLAPLLAGLRLAGLWRRGARDPAAWLGALYAGWATALLLLQQRFGEYAYPAIAMLIAYGLVGVARSLAARLRGPQRSPAWLALAAGVTSASGFALWPVVDGLRYWQHTDPVPHQRVLIGLAATLRETTPDPRDAAGRPRYGLLASWTDTHALLATARRPVAASSFATAEALAGNREAFGILLARDEELAYARARERGLRFAVVSPCDSEIEAMAAMAGIEEHFMRVEVGRDATGAFKRYWPLRPFAEILHTRMLFGDGSDTALQGIALHGLAHLRLHSESAQRSNPYGVSIPRVKAFEFVDGATLRGRATPSARVRLELPLRTNTGRELAYRRETQADAEGRYSFAVPYATQDENTPTHATGPYRVAAGAARVAVQVPERAVRQGETLEVPPLRPAP